MAAKDEPQFMDNHGDVLSRVLLNPVSMAQTLALAANISISKLTEADGLK